MHKNDRSQKLKGDKGNKVFTDIRGWSGKDGFKTAVLWSTSPSIILGWVLLGKKERRQVSQFDSPTKMITEPLDK